VNHGPPEPRTPEDDSRLYTLERQFGCKWKQLQRFFPGRTVVQVKNRWYSVLAKREQKLLDGPFGVMMTVRSKARTGEFIQEIADDWPDTP
jgi:hypothetical protein